MNIFYTEVDANLRQELNARGRSGFYDRSEAALNFMLGKIANAQVTAYTGNNSATDIVGTLGGIQVQTGRYLPSGPNGYLSDRQVNQQEIDFYTERDKNLDPKNPDIILGNAYVREKSILDTSRRTGPYLTDVSINIGDHSMGLLNKATVKFIIPNPLVDLDYVEQIWFRPGRYASIDIEHPESAIVSRRNTDGLLTPKVLPNKDKIKELYPNWDVEEFEKKIGRMNAVSFEGLITSFDFQYTNDGTIEASISLTGTSNVYTDVSMFIKTEETTDKTKQTPASPDDVKAASRPEFYEILYNQIEKIKKDFESKVPGLAKQATYMLPFTIKGANNTTTNTDQFILIGEPYPAYVNQSTSIGPQTNYTRYITLGSLIHFINFYVTTKLTGSVASPEIIHTDQLCYSNYFESLVSSTPDDILLLPKQPYANTNVTEFPGLVSIQTPDYNTYGNLVYFGGINNDLIAQNISRTTLESYGWKEWPGVYDNNSTYGRYYPSRILINIEVIQDLITDLSDKQTKDFSVSTFITLIATRINQATAGAINLKLVSHPDDPTKLLFMDANYILEKTTSTANVIPYSVPMFSNHPNGSIVQSFTLSAKLPENAKNLSYVMNSGDQVSNSKVAPYINFMYSAQNKDQINELIKRYKSEHEKIIDDLAIAKIQFGDSPNVPELQQSLYKALAEYIKKPVADFRTSQLMSAPIFPFEATITIDGINGFRYGDVVQFEALPMRYRMNTVFSILNVSHNVSSTGQWLTELKCIMRPSIE